MIDLHYAPTPNGWKISIMLEELGLPYRVVPVNIRAGEQFRPEFLAISPNNRIPAIVDHAPADGGEPFSVFETGAILIYLADKTGRFLPKEMRGALPRHAMADVADERARAHARPARPFRALCGGEDSRTRSSATATRRRGSIACSTRQLGKTGAYVAGDYSIADIACFPWTMTHKAQGFTLDDYPNVKRWYAEVRARPQVQAGLAIGKFVKEPFDEEARKNMFGADGEGDGGEEALASRPSSRGAAKRRTRIHDAYRGNTAILRDCASALLGMTRMRQQSKQKENAMIEFFFDCSSPWTYLAFHNIQPLAKELGVEISWRPILVGGIFNTVNPSVYASRETPVPLKARYMKKDLADWARSAGLAIKMPPTVFPVNSVKAMRGCIWLGKDMVPFATAVFEAYWGGDKDISQDSVLTEVCKKVGVDHVKFFDGIGQQAIKDQLKANTDEVMARGGFGSPTIFVDKTDMYFGNDRMPLIREALERLKARAA